MPEITHKCWTTVQASTGSHIRRGTKESFADSAATAGVTLAASSLQAPLQACPRLQGHSFMAEGFHNKITQPSSQQNVLKQCHNVCRAGPAGKQKKGILSIRHGSMPAWLQLREPSHPNNLARAACKPHCCLMQMKTVNGSHNRCQAPSPYIHLAVQDMDLAHW